MKQILLFVLLALVLTTNAQKTVDNNLPKTYFKGQFTVSVAAAFPTLLTRSVESFNGVATLFQSVDQKGKSSPHYSLRFQYGLNESFSAGLQAGYITATTTSLKSNLGGLALNVLSYKVNVVTASLVLQYRRQFIEGLETYARATFGLNLVSSPDNKSIIEQIPIPSSNQSGHFGINYFLPKAHKIYILAEVGYGNTEVVNLGLGYRFERPKN
jgi:hypothetical protein